MSLRDLLREVYCTRGVSADLIQIEASVVRFLIDKDEQKWFTLRFAADEASRKPTPRTWRPARSLRAAQSGRELAGVKIALDPGTSAALGRRWKSAGFRSAIASRSRKAT